MSNVKNITSVERHKFAADLTDFSTALIVLAELAPERLSLPQASFFLTAAVADLRGNPATYAKIRDAIGPTINRSIANTYRIFLDRPSRSRGAAKREGLHWLTRETNPADNREKFLRLTPAGKRVVKELGEALSGIYGE